MKTILRAIEIEDLDLVYRVENDPEMWAYGAEFAPVSRREIENYLLTYDRNPLRAGQLRLAICDSIEDKAVGLIDLYDIDPLNRTAMIGIMVTVDNRNAGYAKEAVLILEDYCVKSLNLRVLGANVSADNTASVKLFESVGFERCGTLPGWVLKSGVPTDILIFSRIIEQG